MNNMRFKLKTNIYKMHNISKQHRKQTLKLIVVIASTIFVFMTSISTIYVKTSNKIKFNTNLLAFNEAKNIENSVSYVYETKDVWKNKEGYGVSEECIGVYSININGIVEINKIDTSLDISSINDLEKEIGIKLLKGRNLEYRYFNVFNTSMKNEKYNGFINNPAIISIEISNYKNFDCDDFVYLFNGKTSQKKIEEHDKCIKNMNDNQNNRRLNMRIMFATQYASKEQLENFVLHLANFKNAEVEIYNSKKLNSKIFITALDEYIFVYDNIAYIIDNSNRDYSKEELLNTIELMEY